MKMGSREVIYLFSFFETDLVCDLGGKMETREAFSQLLDDNSSLTVVGSPTSGSSYSSSVAIPDEVWRLIFTFAGFHRNVYQLVSRVSRRFRSLITHVYTIDEFIRYHTVPTWVWYVTKQPHPFGMRVRDLPVVPNLVIPPMVFEDLLMRPYLRSLKIILARDASMRQEAFDHIVTAIERNACLHTLDLSDNNMDDSVMERVASALEQNTILKSINFSRVNLQTMGLRRICEMLGRNTTLHTLSLANNLLERGDLCMIAEVLQSNTTLQSIDLSGVGVGPIEVNRICEVLRRNTTLHTIGLGSNSLENDGVRQIANALERNSTVRNVDLSFNMFDAPGACCIANMLGRNTTLQSLDMTWNRVNEFTSMPNVGDEEGLIRLASVLMETNTTLHTLSLKKCGITRHFVEDLHELLDLTTTLRKLDLSDNSFSLVIYQDLQEHGAEVGIKVVI